jgi:hypothetical protein
VPQTSTAIVKDLYQRWGAESAKRPQLAAELGGVEWAELDANGVKPRCRAHFQMAVGRAEDADEAMRRPALMARLKLGL